MNVSDITKERLSELILVLQAIFCMHGSALRSSLTGPKWRCVYCGTIQKSFIITVLPQPCLALCHHDNHCVSLCFQAPRTGLSQILLLQLKG